MTKELEQYLTEEWGFYNMREIDGVIIGLKRFMFTTGLLYGIHPEHGFVGRFCFRDHADAVEAANKWNDLNTFPEGDWIKHKGGVADHSNPANPDRFEKNTVYFPAQVLSAPPFAPPLPS